MGIYSIQIQNFKSIRDSGSIEIKPLNVLIGANGAGKSNFISFFKFLNMLFKQQLQNHIARNGRADMKRGIYFIAEGATEVQFIESLLRPYFATKNIWIKAFDMRGSPSYGRYYNDVTTFLRKEKDIVVTTMIDFFRLPNDFPGYSDAQNITDKQQRVEFIEDRIGERISHQRFVPYIQLHEFEGLLFTGMMGFNQMPNCGEKELAELQSIVEKYPNPELINDGTETAPSKTLKRLIPGYDKPLYGAYIALENGLHSIMNKCPRFKEWLGKLENKLAH